MKFLTSVLFVIATSLPQVLGAIPDVIAADIKVISNEVSSLSSAVFRLPVDGPFVDKSLVQAFDGASLILSLDLEKGFSDISASPPTQLAPADAAQLFELVASIGNETIEMLAELQTKTVFRNSYGPVALADLNAQARGFGDYLSALGWLTSGPVLDQMNELIADVLVAYNRASRFFTPPYSQP